MLKNPSDAKKPRLLVIGALPPPAIGPYLAMQRVISAAIITERFRLHFLDISDRRGIGTMGTFDARNLLLGVSHAFLFLGKLLWLRPTIVYLGISQGTWGYLRDLTFILPSILFRRHLILHLRGSEFRTFYDHMPRSLQWITRLVFRHTSRMIVLGRCIKPILRGLLSEEKIVVIPNGIDCRLFTPRAAQERIHPSHAKRILYLSHLSRRKGVLVLLRALPAVFEKHPDATVTIAGTWQGDREREEANELLHSAQLSPRVAFVGEVTGASKVRLMEDHGLFVFTPVAPEGLPWVLLEAMSAGMPVVTSDQGAIVEVVVPGLTGSIIEPTPALLADAICQLLGDPATAVAMGNAGRQRVAEAFSEHAYLQRLSDLFHQVASSDD